MANKRTKAVRYGRALGAACPYCRRTMDALNVLPTIDHIHPRSLGGQTTIWACMDCNGRKGNMTLPEWRAFMTDNPQWWLS